MKKIKVIRKNEDSIDEYFILQLGDIKIRLDISVWCGQNEAFVEEVEAKQIK